MRLRQTARTTITAAWGAIVICGILGTRPLPAEVAKDKYPHMAALDQYLMERSAEIALARTAAPESISRDAKVLVLGRQGYETAVEGKNGFVCMVERAWTSPLDYAELWNPHNRSPICLNPPAVRSILPIVLKKTEMTLAGRPLNEIVETLQTAFQKKELPTLEAGAMSYMMSKEGYLTDGDGHTHNMCHLMFYLPLSDGSYWGADLPKAPIGSASFWFPDEQANPLAKGLPIQLFFVLVPRWTDGTSVLAK
jgi:hypothetical protein